jgi:D-glycero-D-manno-heptose 1,7-bisphosphate phosphatase
MEKRRGLLLDRDGVINIDTGYVGHRADFQFRDGLAPFLRTVQDRGFGLAVVTNQAGVARGYYTPDDYEDLTAFYCQTLREQGVEIELVLACFEHPAGQGAYARQSFWRKPSPGMVMEATLRCGFDPERSALLGDSRRDMEAALAGGLARGLWLTDKDEAPWDSRLRIVRSFDDALAALP